MLVDPLISQELRLLVRTGYIPAKYDDFVKSSFV